MNTLVCWKCDTAPARVVDMNDLSDDTVSIQREHEGLRRKGASMRTPCDRPIGPEDLRFGPEITSDFERSRRVKGRIWAECYTPHELI